ncbi:hypothetical protein ABTO49_20420, partial [Acinetobacter baumannii]
DELSAIRAKVSADEIKLKVDEIYSSFDVQNECSTAEIERAALTAVALDKLVQKHNLGSLAYYHKGTGNAANEDTMSSVILGNSLLTAGGIPVA